MTRKQKIVRIRGGKREVFYRELATKKRTKKVAVDKTKDEFWLDLVGPCPHRDVTYSRLRGHCALQNKDVDLKICYKCKKEKEQAILNNKIEEMPRPPSIIKKISNYTAALARWTKAGFPARTQEEIDKIFYGYCQKCDWFLNGGCSGCGCKTTTNNIPILNKIAMATEHCPKNLW